MKPGLGLLFVGVPLFLFVTTGFDWRILLVLIVVPFIANAWDSARGNW